MKKLLFALFSAVFTFSSCTNEEIKQPQEVEFTIDYSFSSGNMNRATNAEIYDSFYKDHIVTREITPDKFELIFINKKTGQKNEVNGLWSKNGLIRLAEGTYTVTGDSYDGASNVYTKDKVILSFNSEITIDKNTNSITLKALYNCPLLFFSTNNTQNVIYSYDKGIISESIKILDEYYYCFVKSFSQAEDACFVINRKDGNKIRIYTKNLALDNGKYYFFNDVTSSFELDPMIPGN